MQRHAHIQGADYHYNSFVKSCNFFFTFICTIKFLMHQNPCSYATWDHFMKYETRLNYEIMHSHASSMLAYSSIFDMKTAMIDPCLGNSYPLFGDHNKVLHTSLMLTYSSWYNYFMRTCHHLVTLLSCNHIIKMNVCLIFL